MRFSPASNKQGNIQFLLYGAGVLEVIEGNKLPSAKDDDEKAAQQKDDLAGDVIKANKAAIENLRPLLAIFEAQ